MLIMMICSRLFKYSELNSKTKCLKTCKPKFFEACKVCTANYRHFQSPVNPLMPGCNKSSNILKAAGLFN